MVLSFEELYRKFDRNGLYSVEINLRGRWKFSQIRGEPEKWAFELNRERSEMKCDVNWDLALPTICVIYSLPKALGSMCMCGDCCRYDANDRKHNDPPINVKFVFLKKLPPYLMFAGYTT